MAQWDPATARKKIALAKKDKELSDAIYREAMELTFPDRENFTKGAEGQAKGGSNWDSSATVSVIRAANRLSSDFTPQFQDWLEIGLGPASKNMPDEKFKEALGGRTKDEVQRELEGITRVVQAIFNSPGFPTASNEVYLDWHFGQGGMMIMPNPDDMGEPVVFSSMPLSSFYAYEGVNGRHDKWFFWHECAADVVQHQWPDAVIPPEIVEMAAKPAPDMLQLASVIYRDYDAKPAPNGKVKPFRYEVFWTKGSTTHRLVERQYATSPAVTPRYSKMAGENRGRGPILFALPDIRTANKIVELTLRAVAVAVAGVYTATENGVVGPVKIKPYSIIQVRSNGGSAAGPSLQRLDNPQRIDFGELVLEKLHENIKKVVGDNSLPAEAGPIRSATEFVKRARELISDQAGGLGRLTAEFIIPAVQRVIDILEAKQILPTDGMKIDQFLIEVRMKSPLARNEAMAEVENIVRFVEILKQLVGDEGLALEVNLPRSVKRLAEGMSIPMDIRNTEVERKTIEKGMAKIKAAQMGADPNVAGAAMDQQNAQVQA